MPPEESLKYAESPGGVEALWVMPTKRYEYGPIPILTINAIDGSIINRSLGY